MKLEPYKDIKAWMVLHDIKQKDFANTLNTSVSFINRKINRRNADFTLNEARKLTASYKIPISYFFNLDVPKKEQKSKKTSP